VDGSYTATKIVVFGKKKILPYLILERKRHYSPEDHKPFSLQNVKQKLIIDCLNVIDFNEADIVYGLGLTGFHALLLNFDGKTKTIVTMYDKLYFDDSSPNNNLNAEELFAILRKISPVKKNPS